MKSLILIAFKFPPMGDVGTRRWSKFVKYLSEQNIKIHVITIKYPSKDKVNWFSDIKNNKNIIIHRLKSGVPKFVLKTKRNLAEKVLFKIWNMFLKRKTNFIDIAQTWGEIVIPYVESLIIKDKINNLFVTGTPFSQLYFASIIKNDFPELNFIVDYRDPWNCDITYRYYNGIFTSLKQKEISIQMEKEVISNADKILFVTQGFTDLYIKKYPDHENKMLHVYSGYDKNDSPLTESTNRKQRTLIFTGNLGFGRLENLKLLVSAIESLNLEYSNNNYTVEVFSDYNIPFKNDYLCLKVFPRITHNDIMRKISEAEYSISINSEEYPYAVSMKVFDYMTLNKKIIHISAGGELSDYLEVQNQIVINSNNSDYKQQLSKIYTNQVSEPDYSSFNIENSICQLMELIK